MRAIYDCTTRGRQDHVASCTHATLSKQPHTHINPQTQPIKVAALGDYDVRYLSVSTADGILPQPVIQTVDGA